MLIYVHVPVLQYLVSKLVNVVASKMNISLSLFIYTDIT